MLFQRELRRWSRGNNILRALFETGQRMSPKGVPAEIWVLGFAPIPGLRSASPMKSQLALDLERLKSRAYHRAEWADGALRRYHAARKKLKGVVEPQLRYDWMFVPPTLWPFNVQDVLEDCLATLEKGKRLNSRQRLLIDLLPEPPNEGICATVATGAKTMRTTSTPMPFKQRMLF